jgi:hypothetical protein
MRGRSAGLTCGLELPLFEKGMTELAAKRAGTGGGGAAKPAGETSVAAKDAQLRAQTTT